MSSCHLPEEEHPWPPFYPEGAIMLLLGSFPPPDRRWSMDFYYPNWQNDMWRILGTIFFNDSTVFELRESKSFCEEKIRDFLTEKGIAVSDMARRVIRERANASDQFLHVIEPLLPATIFRDLPLCRLLVTTGGKSGTLLQTELNKVLSLPIDVPGLGHYVEFSWEGRQIRWYRMPSSSRAYPKTIAQKSAIYQAMFEKENMRTCLPYSSH